MVGALDMELHQNFVKIAIHFFPTLFRFRFLSLNSLASSEIFAEFSQPFFLS